MGSFEWVGRKVALAFVIGALVFSQAKAAVEVVSPSSLGDWAIYTTDPSGLVANPGTGTGDFVTGPPAPPLGIGSAHLQTGPGQGDGSVQFRNDAFAGTKLGDLTELSYSTYATAWNGQQLPYLTIWLDTDGDTFRDERLWFEPDYTSPAALNTWQTWNVLTGNVYSDTGAAGTPGAGVITFAAFKTIYPNATIINDAAQGIGGIRIASGFASDTDNFDANLDNFRIATGAGGTVYDFEPDGTGAVPEAASAMVWCILASLVGVKFWRRGER